MYIPNPFYGLVLKLEMYFLVFREIFQYETLYFTRLVGRPVMRVLGSV